MVVTIKWRQSGIAWKHRLVVSSVFLLFSAVTCHLVMAAEARRQPQPQSQSQCAQSAKDAKPYGEVYRLPAKDIIPPKLIHSVDPNFERSFCKPWHKCGGLCLVQMIVDTSGMPRDIRITRSLGPKFDASALAAVQQYRFTPAMKDGKPVPVEVEVEMRFRIHRHW